VCHGNIGSQRGRVPTQVRARKPGSDGGVGGVGPREVEGSFQGNHLDVLSLSLAFWLPGF
jgi:hypothetical protein